MGLPGHRRTGSDKRRRAAHFALKKKTLGACQKCKSPVMPHIACKECGTYAGRQVITLESPLKSRKGSKKDEKSDKKAS